MQSHLKFTTRHCTLASKPEVRLKSRRELRQCTVPCLSSFTSEKLHRKPVFLRRSTTICCTLPLREDVENTESNSPHPVALSKELPLSELRLMSCTLPVRLSYNLDSCGLSTLPPSPFLPHTKTNMALSYSCFLCTYLCSINTMSLTASSTTSSVPLSATTR